ncbi:hypothetical protein M413DRAFT_59644 [Hebeloma cylindrosporum]|uniref:ATP-dependent DNA helicase n=1 Tax=Hebeloma cylindrosporum TaxID=76867 RepID=A0A0C2YH48_HEBCY|nr:hypothetical protein M413DRAFT_59644 [Hebeloma cylindrosporum h7]
MSPSTAHPNPSLTTTTYYPEIKRQLLEVFKLTAFRPNQLEVITAALDVKDVFVLMPTGGGKSLCYQLPAVCSSGKTKGVTVVVSPLVALMKDQVHSLTSKKVKALLSDAAAGSDDWRSLVTSNDKPSLWFVTPEKLQHSTSANNILSILYKNNDLARFVIDEAHCISTWGQDFREAYTALGSLRDRYESVPIMALTATANERTVEDIKAQLKMKHDHKFFTQSFNRTNLKYLVQRKKTNLLVDIVAFINEKHRGEAGVIYCTARMTCESVAESLRLKGIKAAHFHAGMPADEKEKTVYNWQNGIVPLIVATIAFGMGIDKADVRFVVHYDMPKSLSGYYQETGRAGRDGKPADCLMCMSFSRSLSFAPNIYASEDASADSIKRQENAAREVYRFCQNTSECRRLQILQHFDEKFDKSQCAMGCDNCEDGRETVQEDVTSHARDAIKLLQYLVKDRGENVTESHLEAVLRGANTSDIRARQHDKLPQYSSCSAMPKELLELMLDKLKADDLLALKSLKNRSGYHNTYLDVRQRDIMIPRPILTV